MQLPTSDGARAWSTVVHGGLTGTLTTSVASENVTCDTGGTGGEAGIVGSGGATAGA